jgi:hypothetical protein
MIFPKWSRDCHFNDRTLKRNVGFRNFEWRESLFFEILVKDWSKTRLQYSIEFVIRNKPNSTPKGALLVLPSSFFKALS